MDPETDNFDRLRKLLGLKRYEQPPPGFFRDFSAQVIARLERAQLAQSLPWWQQLGWFQLKPAYVCALGVAVFGLLLTGVMATGQLEQSAGETDGTAWVPQGQIALVSPARPVGLPYQPALSPVESRRSTDPVLSTGSSQSPFDQISLPVQRVSFPALVDGN